MAVDQSRLDDFAGIDEVVSNQRVRAYRRGAGAGSVADSNANQLGTLWMQGTGTATSFASGNQSYTAQNLGGGLIVHKNSTAVNGTLDTTVNIVNYMINNSAGLQTGDIMQCQVFNTGTGVLTIVAGDGNTTADTNGILTIPAGTSKTLNFKVTSLTTPSVVVYM